MSDQTGSTDRPQRDTDGVRAAPRWIGLVYDELRALAAAQLRWERIDHTLQPTALVHEAFMRLAQSGSIEFRDREHFLAVAAEAIRRVLVDHARKHRAAKRGGGRQRIALEDIEVDESSLIEVLALDEAMTRLSNRHERPGQVALLRCFGGLGLEQTAKVLGVSRKTVTQDWALARAWLSRELSA